MGNQTVTMGSKRNSSVKVAMEKASENLNVENTNVSENEQPLQEGTTPASKRQSTATARTQVNERPATKRRLGGSRPSRDPFWYLAHEGELEFVTNENVNENLGIKDIKVFDPSDAQWALGVLANVTLVLEHVTIKGVQVRESVRDDSGAIYVQLQSRSWEKEGQKQYMNDVEISRVLQAQVLSHVEAMLEEA